MYHSRYFICTVILFITGIFTEPIEARGPRKDRDQSKYYYQKEFFKFSTKLFKWAAFAKKKQKEGEPVTEIYFRIKKDKLALFGDFFDEHKDALYAIKKYHDLHIVEGQEIIPSDLYNFIASNFGIVKRKERINEHVYLLKLIGGHFVFNKKKETKIYGFLQAVEDFDMSSWRPIRDFINNFRDTLTLNSDLSQRLGKTMLPLVEQYYNYMDVVSRLHIFKELAEDYELFNFVGNKKLDAEKIATKIFQSSGPIMIKLLQEMQEEVFGQTAISEVLNSVKISKAMSPNKVKNMTKKELKKIARVKKVRDFKIRQKPLGIASIAQAHLFSYEDKLYVVKVQKQGIKDIYAREKKFIEEIVTKEEVFDKGMKEVINNTNKGIKEELNYNYERRNIEYAQLLFADRDHAIHSISLPSIFHDSSKGGTKDVLIMSLADGEPLGSIMEREFSDEISEVYQAIQQLYERFLFTALSDSIRKNFYHGDLHRENIFYDLKSGKTTIIDFGNGGLLNASLKECILQIYQYAQKTNLRDESVVDEAIVMLGKALEYFILKNEEKKSKTNATRINLTKVYFRHCFNPSTTIHDKIFENKRLQEKFVRLDEEKRLIQIQLKKTQDTHQYEDKLRSLQDNIDFIKALTNNCLNGPINPLLSVLGKNDLVSNKLRVVFRELQKNGIVMPKEIIFFNKSNGLLQGIMTNLAEKLEHSGVVYDFVEPDHIFNRSINNTIVDMKSGD